MNWAQIQSNALNGTKLTALTDLSAVLILSLHRYYRPRFRWDVDGLPPDDSQWDEIEHAISEMENQVMRGLIGAIIPHVLQNVSSFEALDCDGSTYLRVDYPELYEAISDDLKIDADSFRVPNLSGRFPKGFETGDIVGDEGGEKEHVLAESEMPSHTHTNLPHAHSEIIATPFPTLVGAGAPAVYAVSGVGSTGLASVDIDNSGGGDAHNNEPQYTIIRWLIVAK